MTLLHAICLLRGGHLPGGPVVFSYARTDRSVSQWPNRRGPTRIVVNGVACPRCGAVRPAGEKGAK